MQRRTIGRLALSAATTLAGRAAAAQPGLPAGYPDRPVRMVVCFPPGGGTDIAGRVIAELLGAALDKAVIIENRPGAGGNIGMAAVARSPKDGYTLLFASSTLVINPSLYPNVPFDAEKDFEPVSMVASTPAVLVTHPSVPATNLQELIALIRAQPGMFYGSPGAGTAQHLAGELLRIRENLDYVHVPFSGGGPSVTATMSGQVPTLFAALPAVLPHIASGVLRPIAVTTIRRSSFAPEVPTFDESGVPGFDVDQLTGVLAPAGTPPAIVQLLATKLRDGVRDPNGVTRLRRAGFDPVGNTPEEFRALIARELPKWREVITRAGIRLDA